MLVLNLLLCAVLVGLFVHWKSPLILFAGQFCLGAIFRTDEYTLGINVVWFFVLLALGLFLYRTGVRIDRFELRGGRGAFLQHVLFVFFFFTLFYVWIQETGITEISSQKRVTNDESLANVIDGFMMLYIAISVCVLSFWKKGASKLLLFVSMLVFAMICFKALLGSNRGLVVVPLATILITRFFLVRDQLGMVKLVALFTLLVPLGFYFLVYVTSERAGVDPFTGAELLVLQLSGPLGNGYSPMRDLIVMDFVEYRGAIFSPIMMLSPIYGFIPNFVWPGKPDVGAGRLVGQEIFGTGGGFYGLGAGIPISVPAHFETMFGQGGYYLGMIAVLLVIGTMGAMARRYTALLIPLMMTAHNLMGSDIGRLGMQLIILTVSLVLVQFALRFRLGYVPLYQQRALVPRQSAGWRAAGGNAAGLAQGHSARRQAT